MDDHRVPFAILARAARDDVARIVREWRPAIVGVDAPPRWASVGRSRRTENELARLNLHAFRTPSEDHANGRQFDWMREGIALFRLLEELGYPLATAAPYEGRAIEVFPHASAAVLAGCLAPVGMRKRAWRERVLRMHGVRTEELRTIDQIDAALAALTGVLVLTGRHFAPGDPREGTIVLPASAPAVKYRPGTVDATDGGRLFGWCACGECDRQVPAGREFAPGHDAKRKSALWRAVRAGQEATRELRRRGWEAPPETTD
jgi:predicted nuclease with RNAse H fold